MSRHRSQGEVSLILGTVRSIAQGLPRDDPGGARSDTGAIPRAHCETLGKSGVAARGRSEALHAERSPTADRATTG